MLGNSEEDHPIKYVEGTKIQNAENIHELSVISGTHIMTQIIIDVFHHYGALQQKACRLLHSALT